MSIVENLSKFYPAVGGSFPFQLDIPYLEIPDQGITALSGPSGSGKTTLFRILLGLEPCEGYSWNFNGVNLSTLSPGDRHIGVVFQNSQLFPHMTAQENIQFALEARSEKTSLTSFIERWVPRLELEACLHRNVGLLSGGERQRVAWLDVSLLNRGFFLLDEPFSALDEALKGSLQQLIKELVDELNVPCLLITHDQRDIDAIAGSGDLYPRGKNSFYLCKPLTIIGLKLISCEICHSAQGYYRYEGV